jgi:hypothetical protein
MHIFNKSVVAAFVAFVATSAIANPMLDVHDTELEFMPLPTLDPRDDSFLIRIQRIDDLTDDAETEILAERIQSVELAFDIADGYLTCNGEYVPAGVSQLEVTANTLTLFTTADGQEEKFDKGIVGVHLDVTVEDVPVDDGLKLRRITVHERITEINGEQVDQNDIVQQVLEVLPNGAVLRHAPMLMDAASAESDAKPVEEAHPIMNLARWFRSLSPVVRGFVVSAYGLMVLGLAYTLVRLIVTLFVHKQKRVAYSIVREGNESMVVAEKQPFVEDI